MPQWYSSKDAGLPAFYTNQAPSLQRFINYKLIFKSCLVSGYGSREPAGWTLVDEGDAYLVLRNAAGNYVSFTSFYYQNNGTLANHGTFRVFLHATYDSMGSNGIPVGQGVVSGTSGGAALPVYFGTDLFYWTAGSRWSLVADNSTFIFIMLPFTSANPATIPWNSLDAISGAGTLYVGDDLAGNHVSAGGVKTSTHLNQATLYFDRYAFTTLRNPKTGLLVDSEGIDAALNGVMNATNFFVGHQGNAGVTDATAEKVDVPTLELSRIRWIANLQFQAGLRGMRREHMLTRLYSGGIRRSLEGPLTTVNYTGDTILDIKRLDDGYCYMPIQANLTGRGSAIATDNPEYW